VAKFFDHHPNAMLHWLNHSAHLLPLDGDIHFILQRVREVVSTESEVVKPML
jgi:carboxylesterase